MTDAEMDAIYDNIDQRMRDGDFRSLNDILSVLAICARDAGQDKVLAYLTATLPVKSKLRARKKLLAEARLVWISDRDLFKGLD